jgi:mannose-6-phosphate isomerase
MKAIELPANQPRQFYRGGTALSAFRGTPASDGYRPEDWIGSTTGRTGSTRGVGLTRLGDGRLLRDAVSADPRAWLGAEHAAGLGADPALLVKLLDAGERLPVHVHPTRPFAQRHLDCRYGKTEAWVVLAADGPDARFHLGFTRDIEAAELDQWMAQQNEEAMLANLHVVDVEPGDVVLVPAGLPHAIGAGIFCLELQEPTDFSVMLEWKRFGQLPAARARLGLGDELARECVQREALSAPALQRLRRRATSGDHGVEKLFPDEADAFFRAERIRSADGPVGVEAGFAVLVALDGHGQLVSEAGDTLALRRGSTTLIPHSAGQITLSGPLDVVRCRPPSAKAALAGGLGDSPQAQGVEATR